MTVLVIGLILFFGVHSLRMVAPGFRDAQVARFGGDNWKGVFSLFALPGIILIVWGYALARPEAAFFYEPEVWVKHLNATIMAIAFVIMATNQRPEGLIKRTVKHPMLVSTLLWAAGHLLANGDMASILLFGSFLVWSVADLVSAVRRPASPVVPGTWRDDVFALVVGGGLYAVFLFWAHAWLFGVTPL